MWCAKGWWVDVFPACDRCLVAEGSAHAVDLGGQARVWAVVGRSAAPAAVLCTIREPGESRDHFVRDARAPRARTNLASPQLPRENEARNRPRSRCRMQSARVRVRATFSARTRAAVAAAKGLQSDPKRPVAGLGMQPHVSPRGSEHLQHACLETASQVLRTRRRACTRMTTCTSSACGRERRWHTASRQRRAQYRSTALREFEKAAQNQRTLVLITHTYSVCQRHAD